MTLEGYTEGVRREDLEMLGQTDKVSYGCAKQLSDAAGYLLLGGDPERSSIHVRQVLYGGPREDQTLHTRFREVPPTSAAFFTKIVILHSQKQVLFHQEVRQDYITLSQIFLPQDCLISILQ